MQLVDAPLSNRSLLTLPFGHADALPLVVQPRGERGLDALVAAIDQDRHAFAAALLKHGALLFRGFRVDSPTAFERVARTLEPDLKSEYMGTSPRENLTEYTFTASELPGIYPIPQHCEMTFTANPPKKLFFCCLVASPEGGETPLADFRKVYRDLDPAVRERFVSRGLRIVRNYSGPSEKRSLDPWKLKRWDEMFKTEDRAVVEQKCAEEGFTPSWHGEDRLRLVSTQPAVQNHPETGEPVWFCHVQVFHSGSAEAEYRRIAAARPSPRSYAVLALIKTLGALKSRTPPDERALHCTYGDGSEIPEADLEHLRDVIWRHLVAYRWQPGDVVCIDNRSVSHGRLPYSGPRMIAVAWS